MTLPVLRTRHGIAAALAAALTATSATAAPHVFEGDGLRIELNAQGADGRSLHGDFVFEHARYPFEATTQPDFGASHGTFTANGATFAFTLTPTGETGLRLVTDSAPYQLRRVETAAGLDAGTDSNALVKQQGSAGESAPLAATAAGTSLAETNHGSADQSDVANGADAEAGIETTPVGLTLKAGIHKGLWSVIEVDADSRAATAGFVPGDLITEARDTAGGAIELDGRDAVTHALTQPETRFTVVHAGQPSRMVNLYPAEVAAAAADVEIDDAAVAPVAAQDLNQAQAKPQAVTEEGVAASETMVDAAADTAASMAPATSAATTSTAAVATTATAAAVTAQSLESESSSGVSENVTEEASDASASADTASATVEPTALLRLQPTRINDKDVTGLTSHTLLLPANWTLDADVYWTPAVDAAFVNVSARATGPHGHQVTWLPDGSFTSVAQPGAEYGTVSDGKVYFPTATSPANFVKQAVLPNFRPDIQDLVVVSEKEMMGLADAWERHHETFLTARKRHQAEIYRQHASGRVTTETKVIAPRVRLAYTEKGVAYEEDFTFICLIQSTQPAASDEKAFGITDWCVLSSTALRAPAGELDAATPGLRTVADTLVPTQRWKAVVDAMTPKLVRATPPLSASALSKEAQSQLDGLSALVASHARGWAAQRAARSAQSEAFAMESGLTLGRTADGAVRLLIPESSGVRTLLGPDGKLLFTEDPASADADRPDGPWEVIR
ncbi:MAG: hypothetical protein V3V20_10080 [Algisphaera sp.]